MTDDFTALVDKVKKECESNLLFAEKRLSFLKTMKRKYRKNIYIGLTHEETIRAWEAGISEYKRATPPCE